jgi:hypothetical protein
VCAASVKRRPAFAPILTRRSIILSDDKDACTLVSTTRGRSSPTLEGVSVPSSYKSDPTGDTKSVILLRRLALGKMVDVCDATEALSEDEESGRKRWLHAPSSEHAELVLLGFCASFSALSQAEARWPPRERRSSSKKYRLAILGVGIMLAVGVVQAALLKSTYIGFPCLNRAAPLVFCSWQVQGRYRYQYGAKVLGLRFYAGTRSSNFCQRSCRGPMHWGY